MLEAGEDIKFIARRIMICASEDVGNADPQALVVAVAACQSVERIGLPEARIPLAQAAIYVACAPKSNAAYAAVNAAIDNVGKVKTSVPGHLKNIHANGAGEAPQAVGYKYAHDYPNHYVKQQYLPEEIAGAHFYEPTEIGYEATIKARLALLRAEAEK